MEVLDLSNEYTIYRSNYKGTYEIEDFLELIRFNHIHTIHTNNNSVWMEIESPIIDSINNQVKLHIESISGKKFTNYAKHNWTYTQRKGFDLEWMHQHLLVHPPGRSKITTDYTFTFYLQVPKSTQGDSGKIVFETEDKIKHKFKPKVGEIFIFPAEIRHTAIPTPTSEVERIVFAGSFCIDVYNQNKFKSKSI